MIFDFRNEKKRLKPSSIKCSLYILMVAVFFGFFISFFVFPDHDSQRYIYKRLIVPFVVLSMFFCSYKSLFKDKIFLLAIFTLLYLSVSIFWSPDYSVSMLISVQRDLSYILCLFLLVWCVISYLSIPFEMLAVVVCMVSAVTGVVLVFDFYINANAGLSSPLRPEWKFGNQNRLAKTFGMVSIWSVFLIIVSRTKFFIILGVISVIISISIVALSRSSGGAFALFSVLPLAFLRMGGGAFIRKNLYIVIFISLCTMAIILYFDVMGELLEDGWSYRNIIWLSALQEWLSSPVFGSGMLYDSEIITVEGLKFAHEHNLLVALLRQSGFIGAFLMMSLYLVLWVRSYKMRGIIHRFCELILVYSAVASMSGGKFPIASLDDSWFWVWVPLSLVLAIQLSSLNKPILSTFVNRGEKIGIN